MQLLLLLTERLITWMGCFAFFTITYTSKLANFMWKKNNLAIFLVLICMVQFNNIFAPCKMNKPAGLVSWQQHCTLQRGTHRLRSPRCGLGARQRWWHTTPREVEDESEDILCLQQAVYGAGLKMASKVAASFFLQLEVPFCSRHIVSVVKWSLSRLDEIKTALLHALNSVRSRERLPHSALKFLGLKDWSCLLLQSFSVSTFRALVPLSCPPAFHPTPSATQTLLSPLVVIPLCYCYPWSTSRTLWNWCCLDKIKIMEHGPGEKGFFIWTPLRIWITSPELQRGPHCNSQYHLQFFFSYIHTDC